MSDRRWPAHVTGSPEAIRRVPNRWSSHTLSIPALSDQSIPWNLYPVVTIAGLPAEPSVRVTYCVRLWREYERNRSFLDKVWTAIRRIFKMKRGNLDRKTIMSHQNHDWVSESSPKPKRNAPVSGRPDAMIQSAPRSRSLQNGRRPLANIVKTPWEKCCGTL